MQHAHVSLIHDPNDAMGVGSEPDRPAAAELVAATKHYGGGPSPVAALDGVDITFPAGRFTAVMGPSGSGKSTMMHCAAGLEKLSSGTARIDGTDLSTLDDRQLTRLRREQVGFVFQAFNLVQNLSASENICLPSALAGTRPDPEVFDEVVSMLGLGDRLRHRPAELSGGQQQRVAVARALVAQPKVIFADEPTGNLDTRTGQEILGFLRAAVDEHALSVVMVTHDPGAAAWADNVVFVVDGRIHGVAEHPSAAAVLDTMATLGR